MTALNFDRTLTQILKYEGGYVNHPKDPGGPTNMGITLRTLSAWRGHHVTADDVKKLTRAEAGRIYKANYWDKIKGDDLPDGLDFAVFDYAINSGPDRAAKLLQDLVGTAQDGQIGPLTLAAVKTRPIGVLINNYFDHRLAYLKRLNTWPTFGKGWTSRIAAGRKEALRMAQGAPPAPTISPPVTATATGAVVAGASAVAATSAGAPSWIAWVLAAVTVGLIIFAVVRHIKENKNVG